MSYSQLQGRLRGLVLNVPTPFEPKTFEIDYEGLRRNIEHWVGAGVRTLLLTSTRFFPSAEPRRRSATTRASKPRWTSPASPVARFVRHNGT